MKKLFVMGLAAAFSGVLYGDTLAHWKFNAPDAVDGREMPGNGARADLDGDGRMDKDDFRISAKDLSGNGNHLTAWDSRCMKWTSDSFAGDFSMKAAGKYPGAVTDSEYNRQPRLDVEKVTPKQWTVEALVKPAGFWVSGSQTIVGRDGSNINGNGSEKAALCLRIRGGGGLVIGFTDVAGVYHEAGTGYAGLATDRWYHVAAVSDGVMLSLYVNGLLVKRVDMTGSSKNTRLAADKDENGDMHGWSVARGMRGSSDAREKDHADRFHGAIDEVAISDAALVPASFVVPVPPLPSGNSANLVLNGEFDEGIKSWSSNIRKIKEYTDGVDTMVAWPKSKRTVIWQDTGAVFEADTEYRMMVRARKGGPRTKAVGLSILDIDDSKKQLVDAVVAFRRSTSGTGSLWENLSASFNTADHPEVVGHKIGVCVYSAGAIHVDSVSLVPAVRQMEKLDRGVIAVSTELGVYVGWRMFGTEPDSVGYNVYRGSEKINESPITDSTNLLDKQGKVDSTYRVAAVIDGVEQPLSEPVTVWDSYCRSIDLAPIEGKYSPNDASVGDLDGDGDYEIVLKRVSSDISQTSTNFTLIEAYHLDGTFMWRINLGPNNLFAPHEINQMVYDFDGDGCAEVALRTCEGNVDGTGEEIGDVDEDGITDYRYSVASGYLTEGPEFISIFDGRTGKELARADYIERDPIALWGVAGLRTGQNSHRACKCMMTPAYLDGQRPSLVVCRGIYARTALEAWNFRDGKLTKVWTFDSADWPGYAGQGNHNLTVGDVDSDGKDEIVYAQMCVDDDGTGLYSTQLGHGDALHMSDMNPDRPGLEVFVCHEHHPYGTTLRDAASGEILWRKPAGGDTGRCCAAHIDPNHKGYQMWSVASGGTYNTAPPFDKISDHLPNWGNSLVWWKGDLQRELLDAVGRTGASPTMSKWGGDGAGRILSLYDVPEKWSTAANNWTKGNACLSGDLFGDWREEIICRSSDNKQLRIFTTPHLTKHRFYTLMHDSQYRTAVAWQCNMYNQPPHPSFYIGAGMDKPPVPAIKLIDATSDGDVE